MCGLLISAVNTTAVQMIMCANISISPWEPLTGRLLISESITNCGTGDSTHDTKCLGNEAWCNWTWYRKGHICEKSPLYEILYSQTKGGDAREENSGATNGNICTCCRKQESREKYTCECYSLCCKQTSVVKRESKDNYDTIALTGLNFCNCSVTRKCREQRMFAGGKRTYRNYKSDNNDARTGKCDHNITHMCSVNRHGKDQHETGSQISQGVIACLTEDQIDDSRCPWNEIWTSGVMEVNGDANVDYHRPLIETICLTNDIGDLLFWHQTWSSPTTGVHDDDAKVNNCTASLHDGHCSREIHECCDNPCKCSTCLNSSVSRHPWEKQSFEDSGCDKICRIYPLDMRGVSTEIWGIRTRTCSLHLCEKNQHNKSGWKDDESKSYNTKLKDKCQAKELYLIGLLHVMMSLVFFVKTNRSILKWLCVKIRKKKRYFKDTNRVYKHICGCNEVTIKNDYIGYWDIRNMVTKFKATFFGNRSPDSNMLSLEYIIKTFESVKCTTASDNFCCMTSHIEQAEDDFMSMLYGLKGSFMSIPEVTVFPLITTLNNYLSRVQSNESVPPDMDMGYEVRRLQSFNSVPVRASPMRLAQSGFYATGSGDETRCYSCRMTYRDWRLMDHPDQIHRSMSPDCPHLNNTDQRNIPVSSSASDSDVTTVRGVIGEYPITNGSSENVTYQPEAASASVSDTSATSSTSTETPALAGLDISKAVYPQYRDVSSRLDSYQGWGWSHVQVPQVLARAGFYYAGYRDCVRCFYCGVGLRTWEREDDPWVEHVRWRSSCDYVRLMRGEHFVIQALTKQDPSVPSASPVPPVDNQPQNSQQAMAGNGTNAIAKAEEMGFQRDLIERAVTEMTSTRSGNASEITSNRDTIQLETLLERLVLMDEQPMTTSPSLQNLAPSHPNTSRQPPAVNDQPTSVPATATEMGSKGDTQIGSVATLTSRVRESHTGTSADVTSSERSAPGSSSNAAGAPSSLTSQKHVETGHTTGENKGGKRSKKKKKKGEDDGSKNKTNSASYEPGALSANQERQLEEENQSLRDEGTCKICLDNPSCIVFLPCGHLVTCAECAPALRKCPICRALIRGTVRAHTVSSDSMNI